MARANIVNMIENQIAQGNTLILKKNGNFIKPETMKDDAKRAYIKALKDGTVDVTTPFADFAKDFGTGDTIAADWLLSLITDMFEGEKTPAEADENPDTPEN